MKFCMRCALTCEPLEPNYLGSRVDVITTAQAGNNETLQKSQLNWSHSHER